MVGIRPALSRDRQDPGLHRRRVHHACTPPRLAQSQRAIAALYRGGLTGIPCEVRRANPQQVYGKPANCHGRLSPFRVDLWCIYDEILEELGIRRADIKALIEVCVIYPWLNSGACASAIGGASSLTTPTWDKKMRAPASLAE
jgi:hypothetical protein